MKMQPYVEFREELTKEQMWKRIAYYFRSSPPHTMCKRRLDTAEDTRCTTCKLYDKAILAELEEREKVNDETAVKLFDEEGTISVRNGIVHCYLGMPCKAQVATFANSVGVGAISENLNGHTTLYVWSLRGRKATALLKQFVPFLTGRRKDQALAALGRDLCGLHAPDHGVPERTGRTK